MPFWDDGIMQFGMCQKLLKIPNMFMDKIQSWIKLYEFCSKNNLTDGQTDHSHKVASIPILDE